MRNRAKQTERSYLAMRRARARRAFFVRVLLLLCALAGVAYVAWLSPQARRSVPDRVELRP